MDLSRSVLDTIRYSSFFHFPLTSEEIHHWLISSKPVSFDAIKSHLPENLSIKDRKFRQNVFRTTGRKIKLAKRLVSFLAFVPGLRMVALTGSVAAGNSKKDDDIDLFFITSPHTLWLVRPLVILIITFLFRRRHPGEDHAHAKDAFCPNLWMDSTSVTVPGSKQSLYTAHEVLQIIPLLDRGNTYSFFIYQNRWVKKYLANAYIRSFVPSNTKSPPSLSFLFYPLNLISFLIQFLYMYPKKTTEHVHLHAAYLHTTDYLSQINHHLTLSEDI